MTVWVGGNWSLTWLGGNKGLKHGFWPTIDQYPVYEWWMIGPVEVRHYLPRTIDMRYNSLLDLTRSNNKKACAWCGTPITSENDSGWEAFTKDGTTQPTCTKCDTEQFLKELPKAEE